MGKSPKIFARSRHLPPTSHGGGAVVYFDAAEMIAVNHGVHRSRRAEMARGKMYQLFGDQRDHLVAAANQDLRASVNKASLPASVLCANDPARSPTLWVGLLRQWETVGPSLDHC